MTPNINLFLEYIPGSDRLEANPKLRDRYGEKRNFYSCRNTYNYVSYVKNGTQERLDYVAYSGDEEKSSGVFNESGKMNAAQLKELKAVLRETKSTIYEGVISFSEQFGNSYVKDWEVAHQLMKTEFSRFLKRAGFRKDNVVWYAGLHENTENKHIHFSFFEKEPSRYNQKAGKVEFRYGPVAQGAMNEFKLRAEIYLTNGLNEVKRQRKLLTEQSHEVLLHRSGSLRLKRTLKKYMTELTDLLPKTGRISYDSANMLPLKAQVKQIVNAVIRSDRELLNRFEAFTKATSERDENVRIILKRNKVPETQWEKYCLQNRYMEDLYRRIGNQLIHAAIDFRDRASGGNTRLAKKHLRKRSLQDILRYCLTLDLKIKEEAIRAFEEYHQRMEEENIQEEELE